MSLFRITATVTFTLGTALALGLWFGPEGQDPGPAQAHLGGAAVAPGTAPVGEPVIASLTEIPPASALAPDDPMRPASTQAMAPNGDADHCALALTLTPAPAAMLTLHLAAPCDAGEPVALAHGPLVLAAQVGADGALALSLPALSPEAEVTVALFDGRLASATAQVADFDRFHRLILTWEGPATVDLHAFLGESGWDQPGHISAGAPVSAASGFISVFGDPQIEGPQARVYTFPVGIPASSGQVRLLAEAAVTPASCGRTLSFQAYTTGGASPVGRRAMSVALPDCAQPDGFVPLPSLLADLAALD